MLGIQTIRWTGSFVVASSVMWSLYKKLSYKFLYKELHYKPLHVCFTLIYDDGLWIVIQRNKGADSTGLTEVPQEALGSILEIREAAVPSH